MEDTQLSHPIIELKDIEYSYERFSTLLNGVNLSIYEGDRLHIKGANGAGKSTLFYIMLGLIWPKRGIVRLFGRECLKEKDFKETRRRIGYLFQNSDYQLFCPTVLEDVCFGLLNYGLAPKLAREKAYNTLSLLGISDLADRSPYTLSGGEKKLAAFATILVMEPEIMLLDEPLNGLDIWARKRIEGVLADFNGKAIALVSHCEAMPDGFINREVILRDGKIVSCH